MKNNQYNETTTPSQFDQFDVRAKILVISNQPRRIGSSRFAYSHHHFGNRNRVVGSSRCRPSCESYPTNFACPPASNSDACSSFDGLTIWTRENNRQEKKHPKTKFKLQYLDTTPSRSSTSMQLSDTTQPRDVECIK